MNLNLQDKCVVITGGALGIGKACVDAFLQEGSRVAICARTQSKLDEFTAHYEGQSVLAVRADVASQDDMFRLAENAAAAFGGIDVWVNNAGIYPKGNLEDMPLEEWRRTFSINVDGVLHGSRAAIPHMRKRGKGVIINAASYASFIPTAGRGAYGITKAAVQHMTKLFGAELAPDNIRVVSYLPGLVATELTAPVITELEKDPIQMQLAQMQHAQRRFGMPEEIAPAVLFLASDLASFITGSGIEVSGGRYCVQNPYMPWSKKSS
ncbi:MAG: SDR family oxidoreductase [Desulfovibrionaceae bacterium]|nr:SDR family oxidoreductase [Desulfovibrionaceae bacterium]